jgi:hypothetical protein
VIPGTLLGLVLFLAAVGPGYVYIRVAELRVPRADRSALLETVELLVIGSVCTSTATATVLVVGKAARLLNVETLRNERGAYLLLHPARGLGSLVVIFLISYLVAYLAARRIYRDAPKAQKPGSAWRHVLAADDGQQRLWATVELKDRRVVQGQVHIFSTDSSRGDRDLVLAAPMRVRHVDGHEQHLADDYLILAAEDIGYVAALYEAKTPTT